MIVKQVNLFFETSKLMEHYKVLIYFQLFHFIIIIYQSFNVQIY
jgi:hypothetical protein